MALAALGVRSTRRDQQVGWINMAGLVAFGVSSVSSVASFVRRSGPTEDQWLANIGTFAGARCFLTAALLALPRFREPGVPLRQSPA